MILVYLAFAFVLTTSTLVPSLSSLDFASLISFSPSPLPHQERLPFHSAIFLFCIAVVVLRPASFLFSLEISLPPFSLFFIAVLPFARMRILASKTLVLAPIVMTMASPLSCRVFVRRSSVSLPRIRITSMDPLEARSASTRSPLSCYSARTALL